MMKDLRSRWDESRRLWRSRAQRYKDDPVSATRVLRSRLATKMAGIDVTASLSIEYSLPVLRNAPWLVDRIMVEEASLAACPENCPVNPHLSHIYAARSNYILENALVDTRSGFTYVQHLGRHSLIRESTSWPASQALWSVSRPKLGSRIKGPVTVLSSPSNYFHFMTEDFPALLRALDMWPDVQVGVRGGPRPKFVDQALRAVGKVPLELDRVVQAKTLFVAGRGPDLGYVRPLDWANVLSSVVKQDQERAYTAVVGRPKMIYAARGGATRAGEIESAALDLVSDFGVTVVDFARLDIREQAATVGDADILIGSHGAALVNALFCRRESTVIELLPEDYHNRCYEWLAHTCGLTYKPAYTVSELRRLLERVD
jgi:hypothetical protein